MPQITCLSCNASIEDSETCPSCGMNPKEPNTFHPVTGFVINISSEITPEVLVYESKVNPDKVIVKVK